MWNMLRRSFLLHVDTGNEQVSRAQYIALSRQVPILYVLLIVNAAALAYTHYGTAPAHLSIYAPTALCGFCAFRLLNWLLRQRKTPQIETIVPHMRKTVVIAAVLSTAFGLWGVSLYSYGDAYQQSHIAYFLSIAGISCVFCLMNLPPAALVTTGSVFIILIGHFIFTGVPVFVAISVSIFLISLAFVRITHSHFDNFATLVRTTEMLQDKQRETERLNVENTRFAFEDQLTGLANRRRFFDAVNGRIGDENHAPVIGLIDLDGFKPVNDVFGHAAGDAVLVEAARRFRRIVPENAMIARIGGDEFGFLLPGETTHREARDMGLTLCASLKDHFETPAGIAKLSGSCGIAVSPDGATPGAQLLEQADFALYQAKTGQQGGVEIFSDRHVRLLAERTSIERELQVADLQSEFYLDFQPIVDLKTERIVCFEALARWNSARLGAVSPVSFIPTAERCGLINDVSLILLRKAVDALAEMPETCHLSFNLSARDICNHVDALKVLSLVERSGVSKARLEFEVTETALLSNFDTAAEMIRLFRAAGIRIALDDFGTGYSSLSHIHRLEFDKLKIDRSFVSQIEDDRRSRNIVRSVVNLAHNMGIACVAEGVETRATADHLTAMGCAFGQGYHFSRPVGFDEAMHLIDDRLDAGHLERTA